MLPWLCLHRAASKQTGRLSIMRYCHHSYRRLHRALLPSFTPQTPSYATAITHKPQTPWRFPYVLLPSLCASEWFANRFAHIIGQQLVTSSLMEQQQEQRSAFIDIL